MNGDNPRNEHHGPALATLTPPSSSSCGVRVAKADPVGTD